ncbi:T9SS type A sorting domain-containing protein [bacterium]|nr:T9SS type A sorting domain-containing protein [bacterium]
MVKQTSFLLFTLTGFGLAFGNQNTLLKKADWKPVKSEKFVSEAKNLNLVSQAKSGPFEVNYNSPGVVLGNGWYDYQANGAMGKRFVKDENNAFHVVYISANIYTNPGSNTTRGSFYSYSPNGINWGLSDGAGGIIPVWTRIENSRGGFPSIDFIRNNTTSGLAGSAVIVSHFNDPLFNGAVHSIGSTDLGAGQGLWEHPSFPLVPNLPSGDDQPIWPVCTIGTNDKIHAVASVAPADQATSPLAPYYTSAAGSFANSFDPLVPMQTFPGVYTTVDGGAKTFISNGANHLLLLFFNYSGSSFQDTTIVSNALYKFESFDNGATWIFDNVTDDTPLPYVNSQNADDYAWRPWQHFDATFDAQGNVHYVWVDHKTVSSGAYYPNAYRLVYKNEAVNFVKEIFTYKETGGTILEDGSSWGNFNGSIPSGAEFGGEFQEIVGNPMFSFDTQGNPHIIFEGFPLGNVDWLHLANADSSNGRVHGDVFHTMSTNGGQTWGFGGQTATTSQIENVTHTPTLDERYPSSPPLRMENGKVEIAFEVDDVAGSYTDAISGGIPVLGTDYHFYSHANGTGTIHTLTAIEENENPAIAGGFRLEQNFPNPFNPTTKIEFSVEKTTQLELSVFNLKGQLVKTLFAGNIVGSKTFEWNGTDFNGQLVSSGTYFYTLKSPEFSQTKKMTFLK